MVQYFAVCSVYPQYPGGEGVEKGGGVRGGAGGEGLRLCGGSAVGEGVQFNRPREGNEAVTIEHVVRDVFTDGALCLSSLIGDWRRGGPGREGKGRRGKGRGGREEKERGDLWVKLLPT